MYKAKVLPLAKKDIAKAATWYNSKQKGLGKRFIEETRSKVLSIRQNPKIYAIRYDLVRTTVLDIFPFLIHYVIDDEKKIIIILAVFHTSQNPEKWKHRK